MRRWGDLFSLRQLATLSTLVDLIPSVTEQILSDTQSTGENPLPKRKDYAEAIALYLSLVVDRCVDRGSTACSWDASREGLRNTYSRQAIQMVWDYAEGNPFSEASGNFMNNVEWVAKVIEALYPPSATGIVEQQNVTEITAAQSKKTSQSVVSCDPPYYDNISYSDVSDFSMFGSDGVFEVLSRLFSQHC
jgi:putative DNA methylase